MDKQETRPSNGGYLQVTIGHESCFIYTWTISKYKMTS